MNEIGSVSGNSNISANQVPQEPVRAVPAQTESSLSASIDVSTKSCFEAFFEFIEWICTSLFCCFKMSDLQVKEIVDQILELCKKKSETPEENDKKPEEYLKLYFQLPDMAREEIKKIAVQYACCEFLSQAGRNKELSGNDFLRILSRNKEKLTGWMQKNERRVTKAATDLLRKEAVYFYALDTILETYQLQLQSRIDN